MSLPSLSRRMRVRVPATSANLGPGFDCLGLALALYTTFELEVVPPSPAAGSPSLPPDAVLEYPPGLQLPPLEVGSSWGDDPAILQLPTDEHNLFYRSWISRLCTLGLAFPEVVSATVMVGLPPGRGLGSSATAVIGGILAAEAYAASADETAGGSRWFWQGRSRSDLVAAAVKLEHGHHADNVAAALLGGFVVAGRDERTGSWQAARLPVPGSLRATLFVPDLAMDTVAGRALLPRVYDRDDTVHNIGHTALLVAALAGNELSALGAAMDDRCHEPYRAEAFPPLPRFLAAARGAGAIGACLSGGGSSILALSTSGESADRIARSLQETAAEQQVSGRAVVVSIDRRGAQVSLGSGGSRSVRAERASRTGPAGATADPPKVRRIELGLRCPACGAGFPISRLDYRCGGCGEPLDLDQIGAGEAFAALFPFERRWDGGPRRDAGLDARFWRRRLDARLASLETLDRSGVWRFRELLPGLPPVGPGALVPVSRPEGQTNCYPAGREQDSGGHGRIGRMVGIDRLWIKHEGENPTGSFKDRGMTVAVSVARWLGARCVACASTGNTSASMAAYAAQAGLPAIVLLPEGKVASGKLSQAVAYGAEIREVAGDFDRAMEEVERLCQDEGCHLLNSLNPFRVLGQQTLALELLQQLSWEAPDWIVLPAGNLGNTTAVGRGLLLAYHLGLITRLPRIAAIQASGANPFYRSFLNGFGDLRPVEARTLATAINIGNPVSFRRASEVIQATCGVVAEVSDQEILRAKAIIDQAGIGCEPASAASIAGLLRLVEARIVGPTDQVVAILTGNLLKDPDSVQPARQALDQYWREAVSPGSGGARRYE
jgi:threonine synthase